MNAKKTASDLFFVFYPTEDGLKYKECKSQLEAEKFMNKAKRQYMVISGQAHNIKEILALNTTFYKIII